MTDTTSIEPSVALAEKRLGTRASVVLSILAMVSVGGLVVGCRGAATSTQTQVNALWYGKQKDGSILSGITPVTIGANIDKSSGPFEVNLGGLIPTDTGVWKSAAWSAASVGTLLSGADPRGLALAISTDEEIDGPSAGAVMTVGVLAGIAGDQLSQTTTMTGTILPDGTIGLVGGVPEKIRAAKAAGFSRVLIPAGRTTMTDPRTGNSTDVIEEGKELGVEVIPVQSVSEAYRIMAAQPSPAPTSTPEVTDSSLAPLLKKEATNSLERMSAADFTISSAELPTLREARGVLQTSLDATKRKVPELLSAGNVTEAFGAATIMERSVQQWNARNTAIAGAKQHGIQAEAAALRQRKTQMQQRTEEARDAAANTPLVNVEQFTGLPDALAWASDALANMDVVDIALTKGSTLTLGVIGELADNLAEDSYDSATYLPIAVKAVQVVGNKPAVDTTQVLEVLDSYADMLAEAAKANTNYFVTMRASNSSSPDAPELELNTAAADSWGKLTAAGGTDQPAIFKRLSIALSYFITSMQLVTDDNTVATLDPEYGGGRVKITDRQQFDLRSEAADTANAAQEQDLAALGYDPSYVKWGDDWGKAMARSGQGIDATPNNETLRREGLAYQWYQSVQGQIIKAVGGIK